MKTHVCRLDDIPRLGARRHVEGGKTIAIFRTADDAVFAVHDQCPHKGGPLSQGIVFGTSVACPLHNWTIDLAKGCAQAPDEGCVERFAVEVVDGEVQLVIPAEAPQLVIPAEAPLLVIPAEAGIQSMKTP